MSPAETVLLERGRQRYHRYRRNFESYAGRRPSGRLLDFGAGAGAFLLAALEAGLDARGVEVDPERQAQFRALAPARADRFILYDGELLPFEGAELRCGLTPVRLRARAEPLDGAARDRPGSRPGGFLEIDADDARNGWDGHAAIPWPPYMPRQFTRAYLAEFGKEDRTDFINGHGGLHYGADHRRRPRHPRAARCCAPNRQSGGTRSRGSTFAPRRRRGR